MTPWVLRLIVMNVGVFFFTAANPRLFGLLAFVPRFALVQPWTILTYQFAHAGHRGVSARDLDRRGRPVDGHDRRSRRCQPPRTPAPV